MSLAPSQPTQLPRAHLYPLQLRRQSPPRKRLARPPERRAHPRLRPTSQTTAAQMMKALLLRRTSSLQPPDLRLPKRPHPPSQTPTTQKTRVLHLHPTSSRQARAARRAPPQLMSLPKAQPQLQTLHQTAARMTARMLPLLPMIAPPTTQTLRQRPPAMKAQARHRPIPARPLLTSSEGMLEHSAGSEIALHA
jgi:hypothetical protein